MFHIRQRSRDITFLVCIFSLFVAMPTFASTVPPNQLLISIQQLSLYGNGIQTLPTFLYSGNEGPHSVGIVRYDTWYGNYVVVAEDTFGMNTNNRSLPIQDTYYDLETSGYWQLSNSDWLPNSPWFLVDFNTVGTFHFNPVTGIGNYTGTVNSAHITAMNPESELLLASLGVGTLTGGGMLTFDAYLRYTCPPAPMYCEQAWNGFMNNVSIALDAPSVPEPASCVLVGSGVIATIGQLRRRKARR